MNYSIPTTLIMIPLIVLLAFCGEAEAGGGIGLHFQHVTTDLAHAEGFNPTSLGILMAYAFGPSLVNFELDLEIIPRYGFGSGLIQPSVFLFFGSSIYGGIGVGIGMGTDSSSGAGVDYSQDNPFLAFRAGIKLTRFDLFVSYRLQTFNSGTSYNIENDDLDSLTVGALYRF